MSTGMTDDFDILLADTSIPALMLHIIHIAILDLCAILQA